MSRAIRHALRLGLVTTLATGLVLASATTVLAVPTPPPTPGAAYIQRHIFLAANIAPEGAGAWVLSSPRRIYLAADNYRWTNSFYSDVLENPAPSGRGIALAAGWYYWNCWTWRAEGGGVTAYYGTRCYLSANSNLSGSASFPTTYFIVASYSAHDGYVGEWFTWRSELLAI